MIIAILWIISATYTIPYGLVHVRTLSESKVPSQLYRLMHLKLITRVSHFF